mmetsp:Transcript_13388/g.28299  ORF Transcript_13388/g.28299 Transcript_13388/m.28299 type:complete len:102 (+) Transcript_13388:75-380(+)
MSYPCTGDSTKLIVMCFLVFGSSGASMDMKGRHHQCSSPGLQWSFLGGRQPHSTGPRPFLTPDCLTKLIVMCYVILALFVAVVDTKGHCHHPLTTRGECHR